MKSSFESNVFGFIEKSEKGSRFLRQREDALDRILNQNKQQLNDNILYLKKILSILNMMVIKESM